MPQKQVRVEYVERTLREKDHRTIHSHVFEAKRSEADNNEWLIRVMRFAQIRAERAWVRGSLQNHD